MLPQSFALHLEKLAVGQEYAALVKRLGRMQAKDALAGRLDQSEVGALKSYLTGEVKSKIVSDSDRSDDVYSATPRRTRKPKPSGPTRPTIGGIF